VATATATATRAAMARGREAIDRPSASSRTRTLSSGSNWRSSAFEAIPKFGPVSVWVWF
jgi:hypothetical protein